MSKTSKVGVYKIHFGASKCYIGSSINIHKREKTHRNKLSKGISNCLNLQRAYDKYGECSLVFEIIELCDIHLVRKLEMYYIIKFDSIVNGYNIALGTSMPMLGRKHTTKTKKLMSIKSKGNKGRKGQKLSKEHIEIMRKDRIGKLVGISTNVGEDNPSSKLTSSDALEIFNLKNIKSQKIIATIYGVSQQTVSKIHRKVKWKSIHKNIT